MLSVDAAGEQGAAEETPTQHEHEADVAGEGYESVCSWCLLWNTACSLQLYTSYLKHDSAEMK